MPKANGGGLREANNVIREMMMDVTKKLPLAPPKYLVPSDDNREAMTTIKAMLPLLHSHVPEVAELIVNLRVAFGLLEGDVERRVRAMERESDAKP